MTAAPGTVSWVAQFRAVAAWEIRYFVRRPSTWVYFGIVFSLGALLMLLAAGALTEVDLTTGTGGKVMANAPSSVGGLLGAVALLSIPISAALFGHALHKDFETDIYPLVYTTPVSKSAFLAGRFSGALVVNVLIVLGIAIGLFVGTKLPWVRPEKLGPTIVMGYVQPYLLIVIPNLVVTGAIFFALVAMTRQMLPNYVGGTMLLLGYLLGGQLLADLDNKRLAALIDPFGSRARALATQYWSIAERNQRLLPMDGYLLANRALWVVVALAILAAAFARFRFAQSAAEGRGARGAEGPATPGATPGADALAPQLALVGAPPPLRLLDLPAVGRDFGRAGWLAQYASITRRSFWRTVNNRYFAALLVGGLLYLLTTARVVGEIYGTATYPVTYQMLEIIGGSFGLFVIVILAFYAGELVWMERDAHLQQIHDATPASDAANLLGKLTALVGVVAVLLLLSMLAGMATQAAKGYYRFEIPVYLESLFGFRFVDLALLVVLTMAIHVVVNHKYVGHLLVVLFFIANGLLPVLGVEHNLARYGSDGGAEYSDMNGFGPFVRPFIVWKLYWIAFALLLAVAIDVLWVRGEETQPRWRLHLARRRFRGPVRRVAIAGAAAFVGLGAFIFYNTNVLNTFRTSRQQRHRRAAYERQYRRFQRTTQPRIAGTSVAVDLVPHARDMYVRGTYVLRNVDSLPVDTLILQLSPDARVRALTVDRPSRVVLDDRDLHISMRRLDTPLAPGDSMRLTFDLAFVTRGFANEIDPSGVTPNGSFVENMEFMPRIGYDTRRELSDDEQRRKERLGPRPRMRPPTDPATWRYNYLGHDADWLSYQAVVSTDTDQIALTSGYLQKEWTANGRRYREFRMDAPILNLWAFQSARYAVARDHWRAPEPSPGVTGLANARDSTEDVLLEVYYHPTHTYNVARMIDAMKKSLTYYTAHFGPYQAHQLRIVEFPRYALFAQSLPNTIPYSEAVGFIARVASPQDIDYPFYVTAHEVAHQWWAHQVIGADAQGSTMLSETMAQYSALMVMEHEFGPTSMRKFLEYELDRYLLGRSAERKREMPLELGENQPYIHYNKGSLVMYALRDYLGEERVNGAVRGFLNATKFRGPPYPTSLQLVDSLRAATPDSLKYLIHDLFETITLYELKADSAFVRPAPGGKFQADLWLTAKKLRADSLGAETETPMNDWIDVGAFVAPARGQKNVDKYGVPIYLAKHRIVSGPQHVSLLLDRKPLRLGIDPMHKLIDRQTRDNVRGVTTR